MPFTINYKAVFVDPWFQVQNPLPHARCLAPLVPPERMRTRIPAIESTGEMHTLRSWCMKLEGNALFRVLFCAIHLSSYAAATFSPLVRYCPHPVVFNPFDGSGDIDASPLHKDRAPEWDSGSALLPVRTQVLATCRNIPTLTREFYVTSQRQSLLRFLSRNGKVCLFQYNLKPAGSVSLTHDGRCGACI